MPETVTVPIPGSYVHMEMIHRRMGVDADHELSGPVPPRKERGVVISRLRSVEVWTVCCGGWTEEAPKLARGEGLDFRCFGADGAEERGIRKGDVGVKQIF